MLKKQVLRSASRDGIREPAHGEQIRRAIEHEAVVKAQALACEELVRNRFNRSR